MRRFINEKQGNQNLYIHVNRLRAGTKNRKAKKEDIAEAHFLHTDIDDPDGYERLANFALPPSIVVMSGLGYNAYWRLKKGTTDFVAVESGNRRLMDDLGGDRAAVDVSRILRLAGTINLPTKVKRAKGRKPTLSKIVRELTDPSRTYDLSDFGTYKGEDKPNPSPIATRQTSSKSLQKVDIREGLPARVERLIVVGDDEEKPRGTPHARYKSRSEAVFAVLVMLLRFGYSIEDAAGIIMNDAYGISESILEKRNPAADALRQAQKAARAVGNDWPDGTAHGFPRRTFQNTQTAITRLGANCSMNLFKHRMFIEGEAIQSHQGELSDKLSLLMRDLVNKRYGFDPGSELTRDAIYQLCIENAFDPIIEYLNSLVWDGQERLDHWLIRYAGAEDSDYVRAVSSMVLIAAVRRARQPGVKFDTILVLEGPQGSGKSSLIKIMAGEEYFSDQDLLALEARAQMEALEGVWLFEIGELAGMRHTDVNKVKAFASRAVDRCRPAYGRFSEARPRRGILIGTTNDDAYLKDETGNRRFWPVSTSDIDTEAISLNRDQLWAEAAHREAKGRSITLPQELWGVAAVEQGKRVEPDAWTDVLSNLPTSISNGREVVASGNIIENVLRIPPANIQPYHYRRLAKVMITLGWKGPETVTVDDGKKLKGYWRLTTRPDDPF